MRLALGLLALCLASATPVLPLEASQDATPGVEATSALDARAVPSGPTYTPPVAFAPRRVRLSERIFAAGAIVSPEGHLEPEHIAAPSARWRRGRPRVAPEAPDDPAGTLGPTSFRPRRVTALPS